MFKMSVIALMTLALPVVLATTCPKPVADGTNWVAKTVDLTNYHKGSRNVLSETTIDSAWARGCDNSDWVGYLFRAGRPTQVVEGNVYMSYKCSSQKCGSPCMVYWLAELNDGVVLASPFHKGNNWVDFSTNAGTIYCGGGAKVLTDTLATCLSPTSSNAATGCSMCFHQGEGSTTSKWWQGQFQVDANGQNTVAQVHAQVLHDGEQTASTGRPENAQPYYFSFTIPCSNDPTIPNDPVPVCGNGVVEAGEACDGGSCCTSTCQFASAETVCRASAGPCDVAETCTGSDASCPAEDLKAPVSKVCRAAAGPCDVDDTCDGVNSGCPADLKAPATKVCRPSAGLCDVEDTCDGVNSACPTDVLVAAETVCRPSAGPCDVAETCTGTDAACPAEDLKAPVTKVCRAAAGPCDVEDTCDGVNSGCPADLRAPATKVCRPAAGPCDVDDTCDGVNSACPADLKALATKVCRPAAGPCDVDDTCDGVNSACPSDLRAPATKVCRPAAGPCDVDDTCDGTAIECPADTKAPVTKVCRPAAGPCDVDDTCDGVVNECSSDLKEPVTKVCRPAAGPCDVDDMCDGSSSECPTDVRAPVTKVCRVAAGPCDVDDKCDGINSACTVDVKKSSTTVCRAVAGACDVFETCNGVSDQCPDDKFKPAGTLCRSTASCNGASCFNDHVETCTGARAACPEDDWVGGADVAMDGIAGQFINAGRVFVSIPSDGRQPIALHLHLTSTTECPTGWVADTIHVHASTAPFPRSNAKGPLVPGQFAYQFQVNSADWQGTVPNPTPVPLSSCFSGLNFAFHASIICPANGRTETLWGKATGGLARDNVMDGVSRWYYDIQAGSLSLCPQVA